MAIENITNSDIKTIKKLESGTLSGYKMVAPTISISGHKILGVESTTNPNVCIDHHKAKTKIVLHMTIGTLSSDIPALMTRRNMSASYLIGREGTILELFNPSKWAYHLGKGSVGGNGYCSKESIAIELSNIGILDYKMVNGKEQFVDVYGSRYASGDEKMDAFGNIVSDGKYPVITKLQNSFRGFKYYASFTEAQYKSLKALLSELQIAHTIPNNYLPYEKRFSAFDDPATAKAFKGVCSHLNFRKTGKWDISPAFKWEKITSIGDDKIDFVPRSDERLDGLEAIGEEKYDKSENYEFTDTIDPVSGEVIEFAEDKKTRIVCENNSLICG